MLDLDACNHYLAGKIGNPAVWENLRKALEAAQTELDDLTKLHPHGFIVRPAPPASSSEAWDLKNRAGQWVVETQASLFGYYPSQDAAMVAASQSETLCPHKVKRLHCRTCGR
jgi:hypothetical protein